MADSGVKYMNGEFKDIESDIERWLDKHGTKEVLPSGQICIRGYDAAKEQVVDAYFAKHAHEALVAFALKGYRDQPFITRLSQALLKARDSRRLRRLWEALVAEAKLSYWQSHAVDRFFDTEENGKRITKDEVKVRHKQITLPRLKDQALETMKCFESILIELGDQEATLLSRLKDDMQLLEKGEKRKLSIPAQKRTIDEALFWELINQLQVYESSPEKSRQLVILLESFSAADIKRFQKILVEKMDLANHYDIWALAYLAQDGCSDDAFESFRAWLIVQGKSLFEATTKDANAVSPMIPRGLETAADHVLCCAAIAHENRAGLPLVTKAAKTKTKGKPWQEEELESRYPILWQHYKLKDNR